MKERGAFVSTEALEAELEPLVESGVAGFDPGGLHTIRRMITALAGAPEPARARIAARVAEHVARLRERFEARVRVLRDELAARGGEGPAEGFAGASVGRETFFELAWAAARGRARSGEARRALGERHRARLEAALAERRLESVPASERAPDPLELSQRLYRESVADTLTEIEARRASAPPPATTGIYHGSAIAARALSAMDALHRPYLKAQLGRLEAFAALEAFASHVGVKSK